MAEDLKSQIESVEKSRPSLSPEKQELLNRAAQELSASGITRRVLKAGEQAPDFTLPNAVGVPVSLGTQLEKGPVVVTFYRGIW